ncbi:MAG: sugar phosphate isomerase/epimerase [Mediterranea sp.]|jgi:sugar phosphate isomerase/epimerase|nr:sugar phosphate isomerase/epimerase [Mediterranea sp.]
MRGTAILAMVSLFVVTSCCAPNSKTSQANLPKKDIGLQLYSLRDRIKTDYAGTIAIVGEMGYTAVEAAGYENGKFYGRTPEEFKADVEKAGMIVLSSHTAKSLSDKELASKDFNESLAWWDQCIKDHKAAGMKYIIAPWMNVPKTLADLQTYCDYYNAIGKKCKENGLSFGYHNHSHEFQQVENQLAYDYMLEHTDPQYVIFQMDVYWVVRAGKSPVEYFKKYPGRFKLLHIKDHKELGQSGMVGFDAIFQNIDAAGTEYLVVEVESYDFAPEESVKQSLDYLLNNPLVKESYERK